MINSEVTLHLEKLQDEEWSVRKQAVLALDQIGDLAAVPALIERLQDDFMSVRALAASALGNLGDVTAVPGLITALQDGEWIVRKHAVGALSKLCDPSAVPALIETLRDENYSVRTLAALTLGKQGQVVAVGKLIRALLDFDEATRAAATEALTHIGVPAVPALLQMLPYEQAQWMAADVLEKIGDSTTLPRKVLADRRLSARERIEILDNLRRVRYDIGGSMFRYRFAETRALCQIVLQEEDEAARTGAQTVLNWLDGDRHLVQASQRSCERDAQELLRTPLRATPERPSEDLLHGTSAPEQDAEATSSQGSFWARLFQKHRS